MIRQNCLRSLMVAAFLLNFVPFFCRAQAKAEPGVFDFYLLNLSWSPEFCSTHGTAPECNAGRGFIVHGLWPQNFDGSYPAFCADRPGPQKPEANLDMTPDLSLLQHEWSKHGTCTALSPGEYFGTERSAFHTLKIPPAFQHMEQPTQMRPAEVLGLFAASNPGFPAGSILLSCGNNRLTAIEACFTRGLQPIACQGLRSCRANVIQIDPQGPAR